MQSHSNHCLACAQVLLLLLQILESLFELHHVIVFKFPRPMQTDRRTFIFYPTVLGTLYTIRYRTGMLMSSQKAEMDEQRQQNLAMMKAEPETPEERAKRVQITPIYMSPTEETMAFIQTDRIAKWLRSKESFYLTSCCQGVCVPHCTLAITGWIQLRVGNDCASIIGEYLEGKGYPGTELQNACALHLVPYLWLLRVH